MSSRNVQSAAKGPHLAAQSVSQNGTHGTPCHVYQNETRSLGRMAVEVAP
jgi:hypothetical protein